MTSLSIQVDSVSVSKGWSGLTADIDGAIVSEIIESIGVSDVLDEIGERVIVEELGAEKLLDEIGQSDIIEWLEQNTSYTVTQEE